MKNNPNDHAGFGACSDRALAEQATAIYYAICNNTDLANSLPGLETFNAARLAFLEALEKAGSRTRDDVAAKNAGRRELAMEMAGLKNYATLAANRDVIKLEEPGFYIHRESQPRPVSRKTSKTAMGRPNQFLLVIMFMKMIQGMRSYWHAAVSNQHL